MQNYQDDPEGRAAAAKQVLENPSDFPTLYLDYWHEDGGVSSWYRPTGEDKKLSSRDRAELAFMGER